MADLPKPVTEVKRDRVLSDGELTAIWHGTEPLGWPFGDAIRLLILTGARREEIGQLSRTEIVSETITVNLCRDHRRLHRPHWCAHQERRAA